MALLDGMVIKKPRVVLETCDSEDGELEEAEDLNDLSDDDEEELGDDLEDIKQECDEDEEEPFLGDIDFDDTEVKEEVESIKSEDSSSESDGSSENDENEKATESQMLSQDNSLGTRKTVKFLDALGDEDESGDDSDEIGDDDYGLGSDESDKESDAEEGGNTGLSNVMSKILSTKKTDQVILSKAKKRTRDMTEEKEEDDDFEIVDKKGKPTTNKVETKAEGDKEAEEKSLKTPLHIKIKQRKLWEKRFHVKPIIEEDREKERKFRILATQGVVQLFGAIEKHKSLIHKKLGETRSVKGREEILETTGKKEFLKVLKRQGDKTKLSMAAMDVKKDIPPAEKPKWSVLAENFYKEPTLQGWDNQSDDSE